MGVRWVAVLLGCCALRPSAGTGAARLLLRGLPWAVEPGRLRSEIYEEFARRGLPEPRSCEILLRTGGPRTLKDGTVQHHRGTAVIRVDEGVMSSVFRALSEDLPRLATSVAVEELPAPHERERAAMLAAPRRASIRDQERMLTRRRHRRSRRQRDNQLVDSVLEALEGALPAAAMEGAPCNADTLAWDAMPASCDPRTSATRMGAGTRRGERKVETVEAFAAWLGRLALPRGATIVDAGSGTGNLLLPLAAAAVVPDARWVAVDMKAASLQRLAHRADAAGLAAAVSCWHGRIEAYAGPCDAVVSLHACGDASNAAVQLAEARDAPFAVCPCCIGKTRVDSGPLSAPVRDALLAHLGSESAAQRAFALIVRWADAELEEGEGVARQRLAKRVVEADRLLGLTRGGRRLEICSPFMRRSPKRDLLVSPPAAGEACA